MEPKYDTRDLEHKALVDIMMEMTRLERLIELYTYKYNLLNMEVCRRFPFLEKTEYFQSKEVVKKKIK